MNKKTFREAVRQAVKGSNKLQSELVRKHDIIDYYNKVGNMRLTAMRFGHKEEVRQILKEAGVLRKPGYKYKSIGEEIIAARRAKISSKQRV